MISTFMTLSAISEFFASIPEAIGSAIGNAISTAIGKGLYYIVVKGLLRLVNVFYQFYSVFAGLKKVNYDGSKMNLINVFFDNSIISNVYWAMAIVGIAMVFGFAIFSVVRKTFDIDDKQKASFSVILRNCFKSILTILLLSTCITAVLNGTNVLMQTFTYIFDNAEILNNPTYIEFSESQYATMARVINTIGNYSLSPSRESRYNINACFNSIRGDLQTLVNEGVFDGYYETEDKEGNSISNWLNLLQDVAHCADLSEDLSINVYYENVAGALTTAMNTIRNNPDITSLKNYTWDNGIIEDTSECILDRAIFLAGTYGAANSSDDDNNVSFSDAVRAPFYQGSKSIYNLDEVSQSFSIKLGGLDYFLIAVIGYFVLRTLFKSMIQCASRIFIMLSLYIIAPPLIATMPWDDGEKFKQWVQAFLVQALSVFGTIIPMRIVITMIPIIMDDSLVLFDSNSYLNILSKVFLLAGALIAMDAFSNMIDGILSNNGAMASMRSLDGASAMGGKMMDTGVALGVGAAKLGASVGWGALSLAGSGISALHDKLKSGKTPQPPDKGAVDKVESEKGANVNGSKDLGEGEGEGNGDIDSRIQNMLGQGDKDKGPGDGDSDNGGGNKGSDGGDSNQNAKDFLKAAGVNSGDDTGGGGTDGSSPEGSQAKGEGDKGGDNTKQKQTQPNVFQRMGNAIRKFFSGGNGDNAKKGAGVEGSKDEGGQEVEMQDLSNSNSESTDSNTQNNSNMGDNSESASDSADDNSQNSEESNPLKGAGLGAETDNNGGVSLRGAIHGGGNSNNEISAMGSTAVNAEGSQENNASQSNPELSSENNASQSNSESSLENSAPQSNSEASSENNASQSDMQTSKDVTSTKPKKNPFVYKKPNVKNVDKNSFQKYHPLSVGSKGVKNTKKNENFNELLKGSDKDNNKK